MTHPTPPQAVVLFAHGSRDPLWHQPMLAVAEQLRADRPELSVRCAYLELSTPDLPSACAELFDAGCRSIRIVPMFLGVGRHAREDLPVLVQELRERYPHVDFQLQTPVGEDPRLVRTLAGIAAGANGA